MDILICSTCFPPKAGGVSQVAYAHASGLLKRGHSVTVGTEYDPARAAFVFPEGLKVVQFKVSGNANIRSRYAGDIGGYLDFISSFRGDVICCHCWQTWAPELAVKAFHRTPAAKVLVSHGVSANSRLGWPRAFPSWLLWRPYVLRDMPRILKAYDHLVLLSGRVDRGRFYDHFLADRMAYRRLSVIPNGADLEAHDQAPSNFRERFGIGTARILLFVGSYYDLKNHKMALEAFISSMPRDATFVFIGEVGNKYSSELENRWRRVRRSLPSSHVLFLDNLTRETIRAAYRAADLYVCASKTECFPLVILDAMASGTPFISTDVGCVGDLPGGIVVRGQEEMAKAIRDLLADEGLRKDLGAVGRAACESSFNWHKIIDDYELLFRSLTRTSA